MAKKANGVAKAVKKSEGREVKVQVTFTRTDEITVRLAPGQTVADLVAELENGFTTVFERGTEIGWKPVVGVVTDAQTVDDEVHGVEVMEEAV